jgi:hypothetical protein
MRKARVLVQRTLQEESLLLLQFQKRGFIPSGHLLMPHVRVVGNDSSVLSHYFCGICVTK